MNNDRAKVGYIFIATNGDDYTEDREWMHQYGCVKVVEEQADNERLRPMWKQLIQSWASVSHIEQVWGDIEQEGEGLKKCSPNP